ncbi:MAG: hypothetical protein J7513_09195 [Solirubrobacteraceae bacterium]|nr:hypothetical protein [Solirubrobacteraceae bacterium]
MQSVLEDAVLRGRMTRRDAEDLAANLVTLGREQAQELRTTLARSVGDTVASAGEAVANAAGAVHPRGGKRRRTHRDTAGAPAPKASANGNGSGSDDAIPTPPAKFAKAATTSNVPDDPSALTAKQLTELAATLTTSELWALRELEAAGKARSTVLKAIDRKLDR